MTSAPPRDLAQLPLNRLHRLAKEGPDAATRAAAQREIDARSGAQKATVVTSKVVVATTEYGTPQPELQLQAGAATGPRELRAFAYLCAAKAEEALARSADDWGIVVRLDDGAVAIAVELMFGSAPEVERARSLLQSIAPASGPKKRGRKPSKSAPAATPARKSNGAAPVVA